MRSITSRGFSACSASQPRPQPSSVPGRKFSISTSASAISLRARSWPSALRRSSATSACCATAPATRPRCRPAAAASCAAGRRPGRLDLDDLGAEVGQRLGGERPGDQLAQLDHAQALQSGAAEVGQAFMRSIVCSRSGPHHRPARCGTWCSRCARLWPPSCRGAGPTAGPVLGIRRVAAAALRRGAGTCRRCLPGLVMGGGDETIRPCAACAPPRCCGRATPSETPMRQPPLAPSRRPDRYAAGGLRQRRRRKSSTPRWCPSATASATPAPTRSAPLRRWAVADSPSMAPPGGPGRRCWPRRWAPPAVRCADWHAAQQRRRRRAGAELRRLL